MFADSEFLQVFLSLFKRFHGRDNRCLDPIRDSVLGFSCRYSLFNLRNSLAIGVLSERSPRAPLALHLEIPVKVIGENITPARSFDEETRQIPVVL